MYTRAVFVEFTVYNANVNLFCIVTLMFETTGVGEASSATFCCVSYVHFKLNRCNTFAGFTGSFQYRSKVQSVHLYQSTGGFHVFIMASEAIYFLFILYYMFVQVGQCN